MSLDTSLVSFHCDGDLSSDSLEQPNGKHLSHISGKDTPILYVHSEYMYRVPAQARHCLTRGIWQ